MTFTPSTDNLYALPPEPALREATPVLSRLVRDPDFLDSHILPLLEEMGGAADWYVAYRHVLKSGVPWRMLPKELGCGSGVTCWRRLRDWQRAGVWSRLHRVLLDELGKAGLIDWSRACLDSASVAAKGVARRPVLTP